MMVVKSTGTRSDTRAGGARELDGPMRAPWWALPGVGALLFTLAIMTAAQGSLTAARVALPHEIELSGGATPTTTTATPVPTPSGAGTVVGAARPVVTATAEDRGTIQGGTPPAESGQINGETSAPGAVTSRPPDSPQPSSEGGQFPTQPTGGGEGQGDGSVDTPGTTSTTTTPGGSEPSDP